MTSELYVDSWGALLGPLSLVVGDWNIVGDCDAEVVLVADESVDDAMDD